MFIFLIFNLLCCTSEKNNSPDFLANRQSDIDSKGTVLERKNERPSSLILKKVIETKWLEKILLLNSIHKLCFGNLLYN